jgi:nucleotide-binding universal stress UspA family protein
MDGLSMTLRHVTVVAVDLQPPGDPALKRGLLLAGAGATVHLVHVITQQALDRTGATDVQAKRVAALDEVTRRIFSHAESVADALVFEAGEDLDFRALDLSVQPRVIQSHATRSEELIARTLVQAAVDYDAEQIVIGHHGRPGCVAEHLLKTCRRVSSEGESPIVLEPRGDATKSGRWNALAGTQ